MVGVEIDFVVSDSLKALELYEKIFDIERVEVSDLPRGENEVVSLYTESAFTCWMKTQSSASWHHLQTIPIPFGSTLQFQT